VCFPLVSFYDDAKLCVETSAAFSILTSGLVLQQKNKVSDSSRSAISDVLHSKLSFLLLLVPVTVSAEFFFPERKTWIFFLSALSLIPLAHFLSFSTEQMAEYTGPTIGALVNVTFGNAGELLVGFFALREGLDRIVKASITGSILSNLLLGLGLSMIAAGVKKKTLTFNALAARTRATMLSLAGLSLILPAAYHYAARSVTPGREQDLSFEFSILLLLTYGFSLWFTLHTHTQLLAPERRDTESHLWTKKAALAGLLLTSAAIGWMSEILAGSVESAAKKLGLSDLFVGVIILAVAGNAAESLSAVRAALSERMDLSVGITLGSSTQVALFVAPALVLMSRWTGHGSINLLFTPIEITALVLAVAITGQIAGDGDSNWFEGVQLIVVYLMLAAMFFLMPG
jgi:Ca2+:H+ antiporter